MKAQSFSRRYFVESRHIPCAWRRFSDLQAHSSLHSLQKSASGHPDIRQSEQRHELCCVLLQTAIANLDVSELALDDAKRVLDLSSHAGLELFCLLREGAPGRVLLLAALARTHGNVPVHIGPGFSSLLSTLVTSVSKDDLLLAVQQSMALSDVVDVGRRADDAVHQTRLGVHADVAFHSKVPLISLLGLMHLRVALAALVLGRTRCRDQGGVHHSAGLEHQAMCAQFGVDDVQNLRSEVVLFEHVAESQNADPIRDALGAADTDKGAIEAGLEQGLLGSQIGQAKPLLQTVNAQHHRQLKRRTAGCRHWRMRADDRQQFIPRHDALHLIEQHLFAGAPRAHIKAKIGLFHAVNDRNLRAAVMNLAGEF